MAVPRNLSRRMLSAAALASTLALLGGWSAAQAAVVTVRVTAQNVAPADGIAFAPLHVGFGNGSFDAFDDGSAAGAAIVSVAEGGSGSAWQPAFASCRAASRARDHGRRWPHPGRRDAHLGFHHRHDAINPFFTFASMVIPSNDHFIGNDNPQAYRIFDAAWAISC
jgi:hypothetical protein